MSHIKSNLDKLSREIPQDVQVVAVTKTRTEAEIMEAYEHGHRAFGENKVQEIKDKHPHLPEDIRWHFIGHLQTNKVKYIAPFVDMIHSADRLKVLKEINKQAARFERTISCLLQFHIAEEDSKFGFNMAEVEEMLGSSTFATLKNIRVDGVMGMATFTTDMDQIRREFRQLKGFYSQLKEGHFRHTSHFKEVSMGMTNDYQIAIEEGSTMVRIGSAIFGPRPVKT